MKTGKIERIVRDTQKRNASEGLEKLGYSLLKSGKVPGSNQDGFKVVTARRLTIAQVFGFLDAVEEAEGVYD